MAAVTVTCDAVHGFTMVFFWCFVFRMYYDQMEGVSQLMVHVHVV